MRRTFALLICAATASSACASEGARRHRHAPVRTNTSCFDNNRLTIEPLQDETIPGPVFDQPIGNFFPFALPDDLRGIGYVLQSGNTYVVVPSVLKLLGLSWNVRGKGHTLCGSRLIALFEKVTDSAAVQRLSQLIRASDGGAKILTPWMERVSSVLPLPFLSRQEFVSVGPSFPVGWPLIVWNMDSSNTQLLKNYVRDVGRSPAQAVMPPNVDGSPALVGSIRFRDRITGNVFSVSISVRAEQLRSVMDTF